MQENFDPNTIEDEALRQVFRDLMNLVENLSSHVQKQAEEIQRLRDENKRLKGEQGKPKIRIDRVEVVKVDQQRLPHDAQLKGYEEVMVQDLAFRTDNIRFRKEKYYSPSQRRTYLAALPAGYTGQFGPGVGSVRRIWHE